MSRNLGGVGCYFCGTVPERTESPRPILPSEARVYFDEYRGLHVADALCPTCGARYLAWCDDTRCSSYEYGRHRGEHEPFFDLSFRSTFNNEPGRLDQPRWHWWQIREAELRAALAKALDFISPHDARRFDLEQYRESV